MPRRPRVALLIETSNSYGRELLLGIQHWQRAHGPWALRLVEQGRGADVPRWLRDWPGQGIIARVESARIARALRETGLPVVDVSAALEPSPFPQVVTDSRLVTELACDHFAERGLRRIAYVGASGFSWAARRGEFLRQAAKQRGVEVAEFPVQERSPESDQTALAKWLIALPKPIGVLACYDVRGQQVLEACHLAGLKVPEEVSVLGVHNDALVCELCDPPLSSIAPNARRAGELAAAHLASLMRRQRRGLVVVQVEPTGVVTRQSTDVVAVTDDRVAAAVRHMRAHACEGINIADVLQAVPMSRTAFERRFREALGCTPRQMLERIKLERVKEWLLDSDATVAEIAERTGFAHPEYLTVAFRRAHGTTLRQWRAARGVRRGPTVVGGSSPV